ncbi:hypothetical protein TRIP_C20843 [Candidatus Zixiibacteriota bacterium]|nr:hypothetical protein TRIP_C20843 [candidate division Zixibacteria bacterium]
MIRSEISVVPYGKDFPTLLNTYLSQIREAISLKKHHDQRRSLFIDFIRKAYSVDPTEIQLEDKVKVAEVRGYIDALYKYVIFEFKTDMEAERPAALHELRIYFEAQKKADEYLAVVTDGLIFELYQYEKKKISFISKFALSENDLIASYRALDDIIFVLKKTTPRAMDITTRFGPGSAVFSKSRVALEGILEKVAAHPAVKIKFSEWNNLLAKVYGEPIGDNQLFIKHTYLTMFTRLLVLNAIFPKVTKSATIFRGLLTGDFFSKHNLQNLVEPDFFSWAMDTEIEEDFVNFLSSLDQYLKPFKLDEIDEDILKEIYQDLVDPTSRHSLGEYYTPDWIADIALTTLNYRSGTVLDPACGSGTFLLAVIRKYRKMGLSGKKLAIKALNSIMGIDVHPVAVMMSKANILLGLAKEIRSTKTDIYLPVYMSDTLMTAEDRKAKAIAIDVFDNYKFLIPFSVLDGKAHLSEIIDDLAAASRRAAADEKSLKGALKGFWAKHRNQLHEEEEWRWRNNFNLMVQLIRENRDTIWSFILKNAYRPAFIRLSKVDYVVGNPPWLAYRYIKDKTYKKRVKDLSLDHNLLGKEDVKLFTQMDTSTLFFVHCEKEFLKPRGRIAFVLPKTTILPAKQHLKFQKRGLTEIHDFSRVAPLFNVRSILAIRDSHSKSTKAVKTYLYEGTLPSKNLRWTDASKILARKKTTQKFLFNENHASYYYPLFQQGATIVPRCFWFIQKDENAALHKDYVNIESSDEALVEAKEPWRQRLEGRVEKRFIFETVLAKGILPFAIYRVEPLFLPLIKQRTSFHVADSNVLMENGYQYACLYMDKSEKFWIKHRKSDDRSLLQRLNYNQTLSKQDIDAPYAVLYNTSGTNVAAALYAKEDHPYAGLRAQGFIADAKTYYYYPKTIDEGLYLVAILNSDIINLAIKDYQPQGLYGERDIHRRPFEICTIPRFNAKNKIHANLASIAERCQIDIKSYLPHLNGRLGQIRLDVRKILVDHISNINKLVEKLLTESGQNSEKLISSSRYGKNGDLFNKDDD